MTAREALRDQPFPNQRHGLGATLASADDTRLQLELDAAIASVADLCKREGLELDDAGYPADAAELKQRAKSPAGANARRIETDAAWMHSIRLEQSRRAGERAEQRKRNEAAARKRLRKLVDDALRLDADMRDTAERVRSSWQTVQAFVDALATVAGSAALANRHEQFRTGVGEAAQALGVEPPVIDPLPDGLPDRAAIDAALAAIQGAGGYSYLPIETGATDQVRALSRQLK